MSKKRLLPVFLVLSFTPLLAQTEVSDSVLLGIGVNPKFEKQQQKKDNMSGIDFTGFGTSFHFASRIKNDFWGGIELGLLPNNWDWVLAAGEKFSQENTIWSKDKSEATVNGLSQILFFHLLARWKPGYEWVEIETGFKWGWFERSGYDIDSPTFTQMLGGYFKPVFGLKKLKLGARIDFGQMKDNNIGYPREFVIIATPLLRINFR